MMNRLVDHLDEKDRRLILEGNAGLGVDVIQYLLEVIDLRRARR